MVKQTPVIVCSNNDIFPKNDEFYNRIISYRCYKYPLWRKSEVNKKLHPVAIGLLMCWGNDDNTFDYARLRKQFVMAKEYIIKHGLFYFRLLFFFMPVCTIFYTISNHISNKFIVRTIIK